jgi:hypothetical protein
MNHFLITLAVASDINMHCYLMCKNGDELTAHVADRMLEHAQSKGFNPSLHIVLVTKLSSGVDIVRKILNKIPEAKMSLKASKKFHCIMWFMHSVSANEDDQKLMDLH